jgi:threonine synthase
MPPDTYQGVIARYRPYLRLPANAVPVTLLEGNTPLIPAPQLGAQLGCELYLKFEGLNPTGSFKDRGMTMAMTVAVAQGARAPSAPITPPRPPPTPPALG